MGPFLLLRDWIRTSDRRWRAGRPSRARLRAQRSREAGWPGAASVAGRSRSSNLLAPTRGSQRNIGPSCLHTARVSGLGSVLKRCSKSIVGWVHPGADGTEAGLTRPSERVLLVPLQGPNASGSDHEPCRVQSKECPSIPSPRGSSRQSETRSARYQPPTGAKRSLPPAS